MTTEFTVGIHDLSFATTEFVLPHAELASHNGADVKKYHIGLGQRSMSVPAIDEDIVTMAATAAEPIVAEHGVERIRTVLFATESSVDQSKAAGVHVHSLLGLAPATRVAEMKQACYGATAALQLALSIVHRDPSQLVLVLASDVSTYDLDSPGEATQGAAAAAILVSADPALLRVEEPSGLFTADVMDFWRPNYRSTPVVDGQKSVSAYLRALEETWQDFVKQGGRDLATFRAVCYHQPFAKMADKAHRHLLAYCGHDVDDTAVAAAVGPTIGYNTMLGNSYTASLYLGLASLLDGVDDLTGASVGLFSYGSGCAAEFFAGDVVSHYRTRLRTEQHREAVERRTSIGYGDYRELRRFAEPTDGSEMVLPRQTRGPFRLARLSGHQRLYERV